MSPDQILDRTEACKALRISRQTLIAWIRKGKLKIWKRVGHGSNAALLFERKHVESLSKDQPVSYKQSRHVMRSSLHFEVAPDVATSD